MYSMIRYVAATQTVYTLHTVALLGAFLMFLHDFRITPVEQTLHCANAFKPKHSGGVLLLMLCDVALPAVRSALTQ